MGEGDGTMGELGVLALKIALAPLLIGIASWAGHRWGHRVGGWLVAFPQWSALTMSVPVIAALGLGILMIRRQAALVHVEPPHQPTAASAPRPTGIPLRMLVASGVVIVITTMAPVLGPYLAGLISPFPVFAAVLAVFTHRAGGPPCEPSHP